MQVCADAGLLSWPRRPHSGAGQEGLHRDQQGAGLERFLDRAIRTHQETHLQKRPERAMAASSHGDNFRGMVARPQHPNGRQAPGLRQQDIRKHDVDGMHLTTGDGGMAITRLIDRIPRSTQNGAYEAPAFLVRINHKNIRHALSSTTFGSSIVSRIDEDSKYSGDAARGQARRRALGWDWAKGGQETGIC
jgi:hypothetical protein